MKINFFSACSCWGKLICRQAANNQWIDLADNFEAKSACADWEKPGGFQSPLGDFAISSPPLQWRVRFPQQGLVIFLLLLIHPAWAGQEGAMDHQLLSAPVDLVESIPADFPRFFFQDHDEQAQLLGRYLWHFWETRPGTDMTLFNKEYLTTSDLWVTGALAKQPGRSIQEAFRNVLLNMRLDDEGYVYTHQHPSHAHEHGWPFPLWTQSQGTDKTIGVTAGWHFQELADGPDWLWVWGMFLNAWKDPRFYGAECIKQWELENVKSSGIVDKRWQLEATGPAPAIISPASMPIDAVNAPYLQLRWTRTGEPPQHQLPYIEWLREGDTEFGADRRVYFAYKADEPHQNVSGTNHCMIAMHQHPKWTGQIKRMKIVLAPGESAGKFSIDSFFTVYDTRHTINNPIFIMSCWNYFRWTGDVEFLRLSAERMRLALRYQQTVMGGLEHNFIRNPWVGHDGVAGYKTNPDGSKTLLNGHGIGNNYWDIMPFGGDDMYATNQYYAATLVMAEMEEAVRANPGWGVPLGALALAPDSLREHAAKVKETANQKFWDPEKGRFIACYDVKGALHDYGYTFLNLDAIWYGIADADHARQIMDWLEGRRLIAGDTSTGTDIYHWRFGPRATTKRNIEWYGQGWASPENIPWGGQVQDGGAVLGFAFYDLWARLKINGPDDAWRRLAELLDWDKEVWAAGGYRAYYQDGKQGTTLQGGGTAGGIGIDAEFHESSLVPSIVTYGFLGLDPNGKELAIRPQLPQACKQMGVSNLAYRNTKLDLLVSGNRITIELKNQPFEPIAVALAGSWMLLGTDQTGSRFLLSHPGVYQLEQ